MKRWAMLACLATLLALSLGCKRHTGLQYGQAYHMWFDPQVMNPQAPKNPSPANTLSGRVAMGIQEKRYVPAMTEKIKDKGEGEKLETQFGD